MENKLVKPKPPTSKYGASTNVCQYKCFMVSIYTTSVNSTW